ncbi:SMI1/KNR4 family protein [Bacillaceae bacterium S4-13-56]
MRKIPLAYGLELNPPVNKNKVKEIESQLNVAFPNDYVEFISNSNGAEGSVGGIFNLIGNR